MITTKPTAEFSIFRDEMLIALPKIEAVYAKHGIPCEITCGSNGHGLDDPHTHGMAYDLGTHAIPQDSLKVVHMELIDALGLNYTVLYTDKPVTEAVYVDTPNAHFHIQFRKDLWHAIIDKETQS